MKYAHVEFDLGLAGVLLLLSYSPASFVAVAVLYTAAIAQQSEPPFLCLLLGFSMFL